MVYDTSKPANNDNISSSAADLRENFSELNTKIGIDHVVLDPDSTNAGLHKQITFVELGAAPVTAADLGQLYTVDNAVTSKSESYYRASGAGKISHVSGVKAWCSFKGTGAGVMDLHESFNIASVTRTATGKYAVVFSTALNNAKYCAVSTGQMNSAFTTGGIVGIDDRTAAGFNIHVRSLSGVSGADLDPINFIVMGY